MTGMHPNEVKEIVRAVLDEEHDRHAKAMDDAVLRAVATILTSFGIEDDEKREIRADFVHLRKWRRSVEQAQSLTFKTIIGVLVSGFLGALWLGIKALMGK